MNIVSLFDGMACGMLAMQSAGVTVNNYWAYEIDKYAIQTATHNFPEIKECGDVFEADFAQYKDIDFLVGGSPCVPAGTKVKTDNGYKKIEEICIGDMVLTHKNRYRPVSRLYKRQSDHLYKVRFNGNTMLSITGNHPVYTYRNNKFEFVRTDELTTDDYVCVNINRNSRRLEYSNNILWLAGRALADGFMVKDKNGVNISVGKAKIEEFESHLIGMSYYVCHKDRSSPDYVINNPELIELYSYFGDHKALHKFVPDAILNLPREQLLIIFDGYISGDGFRRKDRPNTIMWCSSSEDLILSMGLVTAKLFNKYPTTSIRAAEFKKLPSGLCQTHESYNSQISVTNRYNPDIQVVSDKLLIKIKDIKKEVENVTVYNIETAEDHSYTVNNVIVHNCTYWSIAQKNNRETEASGMGWELFSQYVRALRDIKPKYFIYENNKSMSKAIRQSITETFGFDAVCINSALVSAQSRQRLYWVGKRNNDGTYSKVNIEQPTDRGILLKDVLDNSVAWQEKSFAYTTRCQGAIPEDTLSKHRHTMVAEPVILQRGHGFNKGGIKQDKCPTITANGSFEQNNFVVQPVTSSTRVGSVPRPNGELSQSQGNRIYSIKGKSVTLSANGGGLGAKTGLYAIPIEFDEDVPIKAISGSDGKTYTVYPVKNGQITIKGKTYPIKLSDGYYIIRKLSVGECKRLQTVPEWYEFPVSNAQAYKMLGNGWTVDVIAHLIRGCLNS